MSMTVDEFIIKWCNKQAPEIRNKHYEVMITGKPYNTVVFFLPSLNDGWENKAHKQRFYDDAKKAGIIRMPGRKNKWYNKTW